MPLIAKDMQEIPEGKYKKNLIEYLGLGWMDGDQERGLENKKTVDVINHQLKICIEIKDDGCFSEPRTGLWTGEFKIKQINRQLRKWVKSSSKKFANYEGYRTIMLIRTDKTDWPPTLLESAIFGAQDTKKQYGFEWPESVFRDDNLIGENVGGILFVGKTRSYFVRNINRNVHEERIPSCAWVKNVFKAEEMALSETPESY